MPINSFLYPGAKVVPPFTVANSIRLNQGDDPDMKKTIGAPTSARKFSVSCWVKLSKLGVQRNLWGLGATSGATGLSVRFQDDDTLDFFDQNGSGNNFGYSTNQVFRDVSAWSHFLFAVDTEQGTAHNRVRIYHNGTEIEKTNLTDNPGDPSQNADLTIADGHTFKVGDDNAGSNEWDGYIAEFVYIDGLQLTPSSFGQFNDDTPTVWEPIDVTGLTFGNNGFYLDFEDSSNLGNDANGGTDLTETNIAATDQSTDTCSNNFATINSVDNYYANSTFSEGNLKVTQGSSRYAWNLSTIAVSSGKWYAEAKLTTSGSNAFIGITDRSPVENLNDLLGSGAYDYSIHQANGDLFNNAGTNPANDDADYAASYANGDIIGIALDLDNNKIYFSKGGAWSDGSGSWDSTTFNSSTGAVTITAPASTTHGHYFFASGDYQSGAAPTWEWNYGGTQSFTISSGNADANNYGNFEYSVPSGFYALNTKNLAEFG